MVEGPMGNQFAGAVLPMMRCRPHCAVTSRLTERLPSPVVNVLMLDFLNIWKPWAG